MSAGKKFDSNKPVVLIPPSVIDALYDVLYVSTHKNMLKDVVDYVLLGETSSWRLTAISAAETIMQYGAKKYGANNWQRLEDFIRRYQSAAIRHLTKVHHGSDPNTNFSVGLNDIDQSGYANWMHVVCNLVFLIYDDLRDECEDEKPVANKDKELKSTFVKRP